MSDKSKIEWTDATWNPVTGCTKVSEGCRNCYALKFAERWRGVKGHYYENGFDITLRPDKLDQPLRWKRPRRIFVNSMSDLFHPDVPDDFIDKVFAVMALCPQHTFQILTKRPERMAKYFRLYNRDEKIGHEAMYLYEQFGGRGDCSLAAGLIHGPGKISNHPAIPEHPNAWPLPNVWLGVSVENQRAADERIPLLLQTPAAVRFLSMEPLLGPVDLSKWKPFDCECYCQDDPEGCKPRLTNGCPESAIDWIIVGGESGPGARPMHPDWVRSLRDQCFAAGVPFFMKQWGEWKETDFSEPIKTPRTFINAEGHRVNQLLHDPLSYVHMVRVGKKAAGRMLDGRTWDEFPS